MLKPEVDDARPLPRYRRRVRRPRPGRLELLLFAVFAAGGSAEIAALGFEAAPVGIATYVLAAAALLLTRTAPLALPPLTVAVYALAPLAGFDVSQPAAWLPLLSFACFAAGAGPRPARWPAGLASVLVCLAAAFAVLRFLTDFEPYLPFGLILTLGPWALGLALRSALEREHAAATRSERARLELALATERAVAAERSRVTGELNDVLAHSLGAMVLQSSAAADLLRRSPREAARRLEGLTRVGREALADTGRLLRSLRDGRDAPHETVPEEPPPARVGRLRAGDVLVPAAFAVLATAETIAAPAGSLLPSLAAFWLAGAVLVARRRLPLAMPLAVGAITLAARLVGGEPQEQSSWIVVHALAYFAAGRHVPRSRAALGLAAIAGAEALYLADATARGELTGDYVFVALPFAAVTWGIGVALRATLDRTRALAAEAERAGVDRELEVERAAADERRRIARELHDLLATSLSVMVVQASLALDLVRDDPGAAAGAVAEVERSGRAALERTGGLLRLLGEGGDAGTEPQYGLAHLPDLAAEYGRAGLEIELDAAAAGDLPPGVEASVYRIAQEALTNAAKHAPRSAVRLRVARFGNGVAVEVRNAPPPRNGAAPVSSGHGLAGLRERVAIFGGTLDAGPLPDGGFRLAATIPVGEAP